MNNILVIVMSVILIGACVIGFIMEHGGGKDEEKDNKKDAPDSSGNEETPKQYAGKKK